MNPEKLFRIEIVSQHPGPAELAEILPFKVRLRFIPTVLAQSGHRIPTVLAESGMLPTLLDNLSSSRLSGTLGISARLSRTVGRLAYPTMLGLSGNSE